MKTLNSKNVAQPLLLNSSMRNSVRQISFMAIALGLAVNTLVACAAKDDPRLKITAIPLQQGTGDLGGGTGVNGKVFESYIVDIAETTEYKKYIAPIREQMVTMKSWKDRPERTRGFLEIFNTERRKWYIAPTALNKLDKKDLGVNFIQDPIQQIALQNRREVWIDKNLLPVHEKDRAKLYLHEMVVSEYMSQFENVLDLCKMNNPSYSCTPGIEDMKPVELKDEKLKKMDAILKSMLAPQPRRALTDEDYANIRDITDLLFERLSSVEAFEILEQRFVNKGFDKRSHKFAERFEKRMNE